MIKKRFSQKEGLSTMTFSERVVRIALSIPRGRVMTYGDIARLAGGGTMASQSITSILGKAYSHGETKIPFHRIVYSNGTIWISDNLREERLKKYRSEKIAIDVPNKIKDFEKIRYTPYKIE